jgi:putative PIG3 family NAD(P)H quinone oxidoreductase
MNMQAILMDAPGGPEVMKIGTTERPQPSGDEVLIRVAATAVNRADLLQREGKYPPPPGASAILGLEAAGVIEALGPGAKGWSVGDRVMCILGGGGYAEYCVAPAATLLPVPADMDLVTAAAIPEVFTTVYLNLFHEGGLKTGERVLVHGGGSGIGTSAIQMAKALASAEVFVTVGNEDKATRCRALGADHAILYKSEAFADRILELTGDDGVNLILDHIGGGYLNANLRSLALYGRLVIIGQMGGGTAELNIGRLMVRRQRIIGSVLRARPVAEKARLAAEMTERVIPLLEDGRLRPVIHQVMPLAEAAAAHELVAANLNFGKVILSVSA